MIIIIILLRAGDRDSFSLRVVESVHRADIHDHDERPYHDQTQYRRHEYPRPNRYTGKSDAVVRVAKRCVLVIDLYLHIHDT